MKQKILIVACIVLACLAGYFGHKTYQLIELIKHGPPIHKIVIEGAGIKAHVDEKDTWGTVAKALALFLGGYAGIKLINKYIK